MTVRSNKEIVKGMREIVKPFIGDFLKRENYEGMGDIDKAEFEAEFEKVLTLAEKAEPLSEILDKISAEIETINPVDYGGLGDYKAHSAVGEVKRDILEIIEKYKGVSE